MEPKQQKSNSLIFFVNGKKVWILLFMLQPFLLEIFQNHASYSPTVWVAGMDQSKKTKKKQTTPPPPTKKKKKKKLGNFDTDLGTAWQG